MEGEMDLTSILITPDLAAKAFVAWHDESPGGAITYDYALQYAEHFFNLVEQAAQ